jgi:hypothetical protein
MNSSGWTSQLLFLIVGALSLAGASCGGDTEKISSSPVKAGSDEAGAESSGAADSGEAGSSGTTALEAEGGAPSCSPQVTPQQAASTPRADESLERLALSGTGLVVASDADYTRVVRDVGLIRASASDIAQVPFGPPIGEGTTATSTLSLMTDEATANAMAAGSYHDWDCLNEAYGLVSLEVWSLASGVYVTLDGIYALEFIAPGYLGLPGVESVYSAELDPPGFGPTICLTREQDTWHYVFAHEGHIQCCDLYHYFTTSEDGALVDEGAWDSQSTTPRPTWVDDYSCIPLQGV